MNNLGVNTTTNNFTYNGLKGASGRPMYPTMPVRFSFPNGGGIDGIVQWRVYFCIPIVDGTNNHFAVANTAMEALAGIKVALTNVTAKVALVEVVPQIMELLGNKFIGTTADSAGTQLGRDPAGNHYLLNTKNSYLPKSAVDEPN